MGIKEEFNELVAELNRIHSSEFSFKEESSMPDFVTAKNGFQRHFTKKAVIALNNLSYTIHCNDKNISDVIELEKFVVIVRQCVADLHADGQLMELESLNSLKESIKTKVSLLNKEYTHYFPAWTLGIEKDKPFKIGPVTFMSREQWIDSVDFPDTAKENYQSNPDANFRWKEILRDVLQNRSSTTLLEGLAWSIYGAIDECPSLLKISVIGYEQEFSRKFAELVCKTALDSVSLAFGKNPCFFHQQALHGERLPPFGSKSLIETNGFLWYSGSSLSSRIPCFDYSTILEASKKAEEEISAFGYILEMLLNPTQFQYPKLANRWAIALNWFAEGSREKNDAIALAKIATSLDVLSCCGKFVGILDMLKHLTDKSETTSVITGKNPKNLKQFVKDMYDDGRSKILHGTYSERLKSYSEQREHAAYFARFALIECAVRLKNFTGADIDTAFRTIPK